MGKCAKCLHQSLYTSLVWGIRVLARLISVFLKMICVAFFFFFKYLLVGKLAWKKSNAADWVFREIDL